MQNEVKRKKGRIQLLTFFAMFISMCALKLSYTLFLFFIFASILAFTRRTRVYCSHYCPLGFLQDSVYKKKTGEKRKKIFRIPHFLVSIIALFFWGYIIIVTVYYRKQPQLLWVSFFRLMILSSATAFLLQHLARKRFWCSRVCPIGGFLGHVVKLRRKR